MHDSAYTSVYATLASYLEVAPCQLKLQHELRRDWGLGTLDLNLIAQRIEQAEDVKIHADNLAMVHTVAQLVRLVRALHVRTDYVRAQTENPRRLKDAVAKR